LKVVENVISVTVYRKKMGVGTYRFGFNGKEKDNEVKGGDGLQQDYGMRIYDSRLGRFLSVDPRQTQFPDLTPYQFAGNTPIQAVDLDGLEPQGFMETWKSKTDPYMTKWGYTVQDFYDYKTNQTWTVMNYPNTDQYFYWENKYENAERLFKPLNTSLNKNGIEWTGTFREFVPTHLSQDRSLHYLMAGTLVGGPMVVVYGKAILIYLLSEAVEEAAGVPIPDGPVDILKYELKKEVKEEVVKEMLEETTNRGLKATAKKSLTGFSEVSEHLSKNGKLPDNFITKQKAKELGWDPKKGNLNDVAPGKSIGGDIFKNAEGLLPAAKGRVWYEADINYSSGYRGGERLLYSNDGLLYRTTDHYKTFTKVE
jgi:RHS repeat-associated protein